jgi:thiol-disulfide isomerase/thioredoxin/predicted esterase
MSFRLTRRRFFVGLLVLIGALAAVWFFRFHRPPDIRDFWAARHEWDTDRLAEDEAAKNERAARCLEVARKHPGTVGGLSALLLASSRAPHTVAGKEAGRQLVRQIETADLTSFAAAFDRGMVGRWQAISDLAPAFLARARRSPDHPKTGRLLAAVCAMTQPNEDVEPPAIYTEAADLIADGYAARPDIQHFCEGLGRNQPWAVRYERHLRAILRVNQDRWVRCSAQFALASVVQSAAEDRQGEAETLFEQFLAEFDGKHSYRSQGLEQHYIALAVDQLLELRSRAIGMPAPDIAGIDLDDRPMTLSDYRGRVVLMNFWATWCFPCMKLIPHELDLVEKFQGEPFDIVGVNCDSDMPKALAAAIRTKMKWRSFRDRIDDKPTITKQWKILGYPTLYLIDHHGTIRKRWVGTPSPAELSHMTRVLVDAAKRKVPAADMKPILAALRLAPANLNAENPPKAGTPKPGSGFVDKVYRHSEGSESKYVVFVPRANVRDKPIPAILYLHGAGSRGADGRLPIRSGLAKAIRAKNEDFPFLVIFPQARDGEDWKATSAGGRRAIEILDRVGKDYRIDADRVTLTGVSMGGEGTWSLATADPNRWAAIVPICHGGVTRTVAKLKSVPCWCFHGDADKVIPIRQSREMVRALEAAGGRPLYQEFIGVGHNECADSAYAKDDLYEWMLLQHRGKR